MLQEKRRKKQKHMMDGWMDKHFATIVWDVMDGRRDFPVLYPHHSTRTRRVSHKRPQMWRPLNGEGQVSHRL